MNKMIVSPHIDDEVLGCGGILDKDTFVLHCGLSENQQHGHNICTQKDRIKEFDRVKDEVGLEYHLLGHPVNEYDTSRLITDIERYVNKIHPDQIYIPHPSYNQDRRAVYEACLTTLSPHDINYFVK